MTNQSAESPTRMLVRDKCPSFARLLVQSAACHYANLPGLPPPGRLTPTFRSLYHLHIRTDLISNKLTASIGSAAAINCPGLPPELT